MKCKLTESLYKFAVYAVGFYMDEKAAKQTCDREFSCLPPVSLEHNQALSERKTTHSILLLRSLKAE